MSNKIVESISNHFEIETTNDNSNSEIDTLNNKLANITRESLGIMGKTISKTQDNSQEVTLKSMEYVSNSADKIIDVTEKLSKNHNDRTEKLYEKHNLTLSEKDKEIKDYQQSLKIVSEKMIELHLKEDINSKYMKGVHDYASLVANYEEELSSIEYNIKITNQKIEPIEKELKEIESNLKIENRMFDKSNFEFEKSLEELENIKVEYKDSMTKEKYLEHFNRSKRKLRKIFDELSDYESRLLNIEKERLNKIMEITPLKEELEKLEIHFNLLKNSKKNFEKVSMLSIINPESNNKVSSLSNEKHEEVIDVIAEPRLEIL